MVLSVIINPYKSNLVIFCRVFRMSIPIHLFSEDQKNWYARFVVAAILADEEISVPEVEYIRYVMSIVSDPVERSYLIESIRNKSTPELAGPVGLKSEQLIVVFIELILIMISDFELLDLERLFLKSVSILFCFPETLYKEMIDWGEEGLRWKNFRRFMISEQEVDPHLKVPLEKFNEEQKFWYAKALISAIICDGHVDESEIRFINKAVSIIEDSEKQKQLLGYVSNKMAPNTEQPPEIPYVVIILIFMEMLLIVSADESLSIKEMSFLRRFAEICCFPEEQYSRLMDWCEKGIQWKKSKIRLIKTGSQIKTVSKSPIKVKAKRQTVNASSFEVFHRRCFICEHESDVSIYVLAKDAAESGRNIFEISHYEKTVFGNTNDYNHYRVAICPSCCFASSNQILFRKDSSQAMPQKFMAEGNRKIWIKRSIETRPRIKAEVDFYDHANRGVDGALIIYQQAVESERFFLYHDHDKDSNDEIISLKLYMAEILMKENRREDAEKQLMEVAKIANDKFCHSKHRLSVSSFKKAKLLFLISLYFEDREKATCYYNYFNDALKTAEENNLDDVYLKLREITQLVTLIFKHKESYFRSNLNGFCLGKIGENDL